MKHVVLFAGLLLATTSGCSAIAARDPGPIHCESDGVNDPCPTGMRCIGNVCIAATCVPVTETCNGLDDDCNGMIDDGMICGTGICLHGACRLDCSPGETCNGLDDDCDGMIDEGLDVDEDADTYVACQMGHTLDCNDRDPMVHPHATEICNGFDDDCDPSTMESAGTICSPDGSQICAVPHGETLPRCVDPTDCRNFPCTGSLICSDTGHVGTFTCCVAGTAGCGMADDCRTTHCMAGQRCAMSGTASVTYACVPLATLGDACTLDAECASNRCYARESLRLTGAGSICGQACCRDTDCTGGAVCWAPGTGARSCVLPSEVQGVAHGYQLCQTTGQCSGSQACTLAGIPGVGSAMEAAWICGAPGTQDCGITGACESRFCRGSAFCVEPCRSDDDCGFFAPACSYINVDVGGRNDWLTGCFYHGGGAQGDACANDGDCVDQFCLAGHCSQICCSNATCPSGSSCGPVNHAGWEMRCFPNAPVM